MILKTPQTEIRNPNYRNPNEDRNPKSEKRFSVGARQVSQRPSRDCDRSGIRLRISFGSRISDFGFSSPRNAGFTLIELVISAAVAAMILTGAYMCLNAGLSSQKLIEPRSEVAQTARVVLAMMTADLRSACSLSQDFDFLGMDRTIEDVEADNLDFATHNYTPRHPGEGDFCEVSYFMEKDEKGKFNLWRRRNPTIALKVLEGGRREEIAKDLLGVRFEYYDGFEWFDDWGQLEKPKEKSSLLDAANLSGMPEAVRVTLWFDPNPKKPSSAASSETVDLDTALVFQAVVRLELAGLSANGGKTSNAQNGTGAKNEKGANQ